LIRQQLCQLKQRNVAEREEAGHSARLFAGMGRGKPLAYSTSLNALRIGPPPPGSPVQVSVRRM